MGEIASARQEEIATLRLGLELGATLIDTAEMYAEGGAEELVGEAVRGKRDGVFLVSKVYPQNASLKGVVAACERSLARLRTDRLDLYLLHWPGSVPVSETLEGFQSLKDAGKIRHYGVSNFDRPEMQELWVAKGGNAVTTNQVLYNLTRRAIEWDLLPWQREHDVPIMAYSPLEQARLAGNRKLVTFARRHDLTPAQAALGWLLAKKDVIVIPKSASPERLRENLAALEKPLSGKQLSELDELFPPPKVRRPLEML